MFEEKDIQFLDKTAKSFLSIVKKIVKNYSYSKADSYSKTEVDAAVSTGTAGLYSIRGSWDASGGLFPTTGGRGIGGLPKAGDGWNISVAGIMGGKLYSIGDGIIALIDTPAQTAANWEDAEGNLGFTPENSSNKEDTTLDTSTSKYPTNRLVKASIDALSSVYTTTAAVATQISTALSGYLTAATAASTYAAILTATNFGDFLVGLTGKTTPVNADSIVITDSEASDDAKKVTLTNFKAFLKTYFDTLYGAAGAASESASGIAELATQAEADTGTDDLRIITPLKLKTRQGMRYVGRLTASNSASLEQAVSTGKMYHFELNYLRAANNTNAICVQVSTDNGSSYSNSSYLSRNSWGSTSDAEASNTNNTGRFSLTRFDADGNTGQSTQSWGGMNGFFDLYNPSSTAKYKMAMWMNSYEVSDSYQYQASVRGCGRWSSTTAVNKVRFIMKTPNSDTNGGNIVDGHIDVWEINA